jgi:hypothetical protein
MTSLERFGRPKKGAVAKKVSQAKLDSSMGCYALRSFPLALGSPFTGRTHQLKRPHATEQPLP